MINIRQNVFETNSSSSHSFSLSFHDDPDITQTIIPNENGQILFTGGNFTRSEFSILSSLDKANAVATYIIVYGDEKLKERFEKVVKEHTSAIDILYDIRLTGTSDQPPNTFYCPRLGSAYSYYYDEEKDEEFEISFKEILSDEKLLKTFLFSKKAYFEVGIQDC